MENAELLQLRWGGCHLWLLYILLSFPLPTMSPQTYHEREREREQKRRKALAHLQGEKGPGEPKQQHEVTLARLEQPWSPESPDPSDIARFAEDLPSPHNRRPPPHQQAASEDRYVTSVTEIIPSITFNQHRMGSTTGELFPSNQLPLY